MDASFPLSPLSLSFLTPTHPHMYVQGQGSEPVPVATPLPVLSHHPQGQQALYLPLRKTEVDFPTGK